jgi:hypothetical protein
MTVHRCAVLLSCLCVVCMFACCLLVVGVFAIVDIAVGRFDNALVSLCVWNAGSKCHAPDLALVMFEGLLLLCFDLVSFHFTIIYYITFHFMHSQYDRASLCCAVFLLMCLCVVCMLACLLVGVFAIVDIAVGRFG